MGSKHSPSEVMAWQAIPPRSSAPIGAKKEPPSVSSPMLDAEDVPQAKSMPPAKEAAGENASSSRTSLPHAKEAAPSTSEIRPTQAVAAPSEALQVETPGYLLARAIKDYLQEHTQANRRPKTLDWHRVALSFLQRYLHSQHILSVQELTQDRIQRWTTWLQETPGRSGTMHTVDTIVTYARSVRAFCRWLVSKGLLARSPFSDMIALKADSPPIQTVEPEHFARLLAGCRPLEHMSPGEEIATLRNETLLWLFWEGGLSVSEACTLRVGTVSLHQGIAHLSGPGAKERRIALGQESQRSLGLYLARLFQQREALQADTWLFWTERGTRLTNNAVTLLFVRINQRAGMVDEHITPSMLRETFAVRYLQSGGQVQALQEILGLHDRNSVKRFPQAAGLWERQPAGRRRKRRKKRSR
jgi:site-specific recombinase XerD